MSTDASGDEQTIAAADDAFQTAREGSVDTMARLLDAGVPANLCNPKGDSLLMLASYNGNAPVVALLLARQADPTLANQKGQLPLAAAAFKADARVLHALLDGGVPVDGAGPDGRTALFMAAMFNRTEVVDWFLAKGADPRVCDTRGLTAADAARKMGATDTPAQIEAAIQAFHADT